MAINWRSFSWTMTLYIMLGSLSPQLVSSRPVNGENQPAIGEPSQNSRLAPSICYIQFEDGRLIDLQSICGNPKNLSQPSQFQTTQSIQPRFGATRAYSSDSNPNNSDDDPN